MYAKFGKIRKVVMVYDKYSGLSRGFGFVTFSTIEEASEARDKTTGELLHGRRIRVDYSLTERPHSPTPGGYKGVPSSRSRRSPSPYRSGRRSPSPRRNGDRSISPRPRRRPDSPPSRDSRRSVSPRAPPADRKERSISVSPRRERSNSRSLT